MPPKKEKKKLQIVKVPLERVPIDIPSRFKKMPQLYLELLENKEKIIPTLRDQEYIPRILTEMNKELLDNRNTDLPISLDTKPVENTEINISFDERVSPKKKDTLNILDSEIDKYDLFRQEMDEKNRYENEKFKRESRDQHHSERSRERESRNRHRESRNRESREKEKEKEKLESRDKEKRESRNRDKEKRESRHKSRHESRHKSRHESRHKSRHKSHKSKHKSHHRSRDEFKDESRQDEYRKEKDDILNNESNIQKDLEELLQGKSTETISMPISSEKKEESQTYKLPPRLSEIKKGETGQQTYTLGPNQIRHISQSSLAEDDELNKKRELLFRFDILRKSYKENSIPEYSEYTSLETMQRSYDDTIRRVHLDSNVESYRKYMIYAFTGIEYVLKNWFNMKIVDGLTQQQVLSMSSYERLLIELGEKSYLSGASSWPVEVRLLCLVLINTAFFIGMKMIAEKADTNILGMFNNMNQTKVAAPANSVPIKKKHMKGPNINLSDLGNNDDKKKQE